jgi:hypothetical protein
VDGINRNYWIFSPEYALLKSARCTKNKVTAYSVAQEDLNGLFCNSPIAFDAEFDLGGLAVIGDDNRP